MKNKNKLKIGIDGYQIHSGMRGMGYYVFNLIKNLYKSVDFVIFYHNKEIFEFFNKNERKNIEFAKLEFKNLDDKYIKNEFFWNIKTISDAVNRRNDLDLFHGTQNQGSIISSCAYVVTIHDLISFNIKKHFLNKEEENYYKIGVNIAAKCSNAIIAVSKNTKKDVIKFLNVESPKIKVIYNGFDKPILSQIEIDKNKKRVFKNFGIKNDKFIFFLGEIAPKKNIIRMIQAYSKSKIKNKFDFIISGTGDKIYEDDLKKIIKQLQLTNKIKIIGYLSFLEKNVFYKNATLFIFPSLYEGFGIPPLEAMSFGTPVLTSKISSLPEIVGNAGILCDPYSVSDIKNSLNLILKNEKKLKLLSEKSKKQAEKFSWVKMANETLKLYKEVTKNYEKRF
ncbi:MAG: glycosyltransferase family 4 protein [Candidatus Omnitrophica bacterium]|nr:glycosyltransferase family 4 protein [Candidatus Omnitrophota bacterium]